MIIKNIPTFIIDFIAFFHFMLNSCFNTFHLRFKQILGLYLLGIFIVPITFTIHYYPSKIRAILINTGLLRGLILGLNKEKESSLKDLFSNQMTKQ